MTMEAAAVSRTVLGIGVVGVLLWAPGSANQLVEVLQGCSKG